jgi:hypothetical protein
MRLFELALEGDAEAALWMARIHAKLPKSEFEHVEEVRRLGLAGAWYRIRRGDADSIPDGDQDLAVLQGEGEAPNVELSLAEAWKRVREGLPRELVGFQAGSSRSGSPR